MASPIPQKPRPSIQDRQLIVNPSYSSATSTSDGRRLVRDHMCADWPSTCGSWVSVDCSHSSRSSTWVPAASKYTGGLGRSRAASTAETTTAVEASHGTSQSYSPNGLVIGRADR